MGENIDFIKQVLVFENDDFKFYRTEFTKSLTKWATDPDLFDITLDNWMVLLAESKINGGSEYVLLNDEGRIVDSNTLFEGLAVCIDKFKIMKQFNRGE